MVAIFTIPVLFAELCLLSLINISADASEISDVLVIATILVFSVAYVFALNKSKKLQNVKFTLFCGYIIRVILVFWQIFGRDIFMLPYSANDANGFYKSAVQASYGIDVWYGAPFITIIGKIFSFTGISRLLGQFLIMLCSIVAIHVAAAILSKTGIDKGAQNRSLFILCVLPNFAFLSCGFLRESVIIMFMAMSIYCFIRWFQEKNELYFFAAFALVFFGARFHAGVVGLAVGYIVVRVLYNSKKQEMNLSVRGIFFATIFLLIFVFLYNNYSDILFGKVNGVEAISDIAQTGYSGGSDYSKYVGNSNNPINLIIYTPIRIIYFLFSPFPWQWRNLTDVIAFCFSSMFYMWSLICAVRYLKDKESENKQLVIVLLILVICSVFVFGWGASNTGNAIRHRDKLVVLYLVLYAITSKKKRIEKRVMR